MRRSLFTAVATALLAVPALAALPDGTKAPDFSTEASLAGKSFKFALADALKKGPVVLYFYPAAFTPGCTVEAHEFAEATDKFKALGATVIGVSHDPIEKLNLFFLNGLLKVEGAVRKFISVRFTVEIRELIASGTTVRVPLTNVQAFGGLPIPQFLFPLVQSRLPKGLVTYEPPATFVVQLASFVPPFVQRLPTCVPVLVEYL